MVKAKNYNKIEMRLFQKISSSLKLVSLSIVSLSVKLKIFPSILSTGKTSKEEIDMIREYTNLVVSGNYNESRGICVMICSTFIMPQRY